MPCLDEAETFTTCIAKAIDYLRRRGIDGEVLVADNGSTDGSPASPASPRRGSWPSPNRATVMHCSAGSAPLAVAT